MPEDKKQTPKPDETPKEPEKPQVSNEEVLAAAREANWRALAAERQAQLAMNRMERPEPTPQRADPLDRYTTEDLVMSPEDKKRALSDAISIRAKAEGDRVRSEVAQQMALERQAAESRNALDYVMATRPELSDPKNASNFAASLSKAKYEAEAAGITLTPFQLAQQAGKVYDEVFRKTPPPPPPYTEGGHRPDLGSPYPMPPDMQTSQSWLEKKYGLKKGMVREMYDSNDGAAIDKLNLEYVRHKNGGLLKKGVVTNLDTIRAQSEDPALETS